MLIIRVRGDVDPIWLGHAIRKNPMTYDDKGPFKKATPSGVFHGSFIEKGSLGYKAFQVEYKPNPDTPIFEDEIDLMSVNHLCHPALYRQAISNLLGSALKEAHELDSECEIEFLLMTKKGNSFFYAFDIQEEEKKSHLYAYRVCKSFSSIHVGLNWLMSLSFALTPFIKGDEVKKAALCTNRAGLGYYARYLISAKTQQGKLFNTDSIRMAGGHSNQQRRAAIKEVLKNSNSHTLLDLGCGSLFNLEKLIPQYKTLIGVDKERNFRPSMEQMFSFHEMDILDYLRQSPSLDGVDVLLAEVLEHNEKEKASEILEVLFTLSPSSVVITLPNRDFNINWGGIGSRHPDHDWEPSMQEVISMMQQRDGYSLSIRGIGDTVDNVPLSILVHYTKQGAKK